MRYDTESGAPSKIQGRSQHTFTFPLQKSSAVKVVFKDHPCCSSKMEQFIIRTIAVTSENASVPTQAVQAAVTSHPWKSS